MSLYSTDATVKKYCEEILREVPALEEYHEEAAVEIDRDLELRWYRPESVVRGVDYQATPFDREELHNVTTQLARLGTFKAIALAAEAISTYHPDGDKFGRIAERFAARYAAELDTVIEYGIEYDWDEDDTLDEDEQAATQVRRLRRI